MKRAFLIGLAVLVSINAPAQTWTAINLHPTGATDSRLHDTTETQQVGSADFATLSHAALWTGTAASFVDLHPAGATLSYLHAIRDDQQVGTAFFGRPRAGIWSGTAASFLNVHPAGPTESEIFGTTGSQQSGYILSSGVRFAALWGGTIASFVNLNPAGATASRAYTTNGSRQVGYAIFAGITRATMWSGSAAGVTDLHPAGAVYSTAEGIEDSPKFDAQVVGYAIIADRFHAALWSGTAASFIDLHPAGAVNSSAEGTNGTLQVGYTSDGGTSHAALWRGSAASYVDLHAFLAPNFSDSIARAVWSNGTTTLVAGYAFNITAKRFEAMLWKQASEETSRGKPGIAVKGKRTRITTARKITIRGTSVSAERVEAKLAKARYKPARGTATWSYRAKLQPGRNRVLVRAVNALGETSPALKISIIRN